MTVPASRFQNVNKAYGGSKSLFSSNATTIALDAFTLQIEAGACFGLVGANGAGKTTLIKCLLDSCEPNSGNIDIFGLSHRLTPSRARLAYLPERFNPPHNLTGRDFLQYMATIPYVLRYEGYLPAPIPLRQTAATLVDFSQ